MYSLYKLVQVNYFRIKYFRHFAQNEKFLTKFSQITVIKMCLDPGMHRPPHLWTYCTWAYLVVQNLSLSLSLSPLTLLVFLWMVVDVIWNLLLFSVPWVTPVHTVARETDQIGCYSNSAPWVTLIVQNCLAVLSSNCVSPPAPLGQSTGIFPAVALVADSRISSVVWVIGNAQLTEANRTISYWKGQTLWHLCSLSPPLGHLQATRAVGRKGLVTRFHSWRTATTCKLTQETEQLLSVGGTGTPSFINRGWLADRPWSCIPDMYTR